MTITKGNDTSSKNETTIGKRTTTNKPNNGPIPIITYYDNTYK